MAQSIFMLNLKTIIYDVFQTIFLPDLPHCADTALQPGTTRLTAKIYY